MHRSLRLFVVLAVLIAGWVVAVRPAAAQGVPRTLAATAHVGADPVALPFGADFVAVQWDGDATGAVRLRRAGRWSDWQALVQDDLAEPGRFASTLVPAGKADAYQVRVDGPAGNARAVAINTTDGPRNTSSASLPAAGAATAVISRAGWGADESLRFDATGKEIWPPTYYPTQKLTVHHTDTANGDPDPAATVRAIYRYHAVDKGWGDIGYQYLVDESGRVYEGRWSGTDGDPAHDAAGNGVTGAHVAGWNSGNLGVALLGTLTTQKPTTAAQSSLESLLADLATRHHLDPQGTTTYVNPVNGATIVTPNIAGHRDYEATECPGGAMYALLPTVRADVAARMSGTTTTSSTTSTTSTTVRPKKGHK